MSANDDFNRTAIQRIQKRQIAFARNAIDPLNAMGFQAFNNEVRGAH
jgi:hypothetical protein